MAGAFAKGDPVEYYSTTNDRWCPGTVKKFSETHGMLVTFSRSGEERDVLVDAADFGWKLRAPVRGILRTTYYVNFCLLAS